MVRTRSDLNWYHSHWKETNCISSLTDRPGGKDVKPNPLFIIPNFFCIFPMNFAMATLGLKEMGKFHCEGREKGLPCWLSQFRIPLSLKNLLLKCLKICIISFRLWCWRSFRHRRFRFSVPTHAFGVNPTRSCENRGCQFWYVKKHQIEFCKCLSK